MSSINKPRRSCFDRVIITFTHSSCCFLSSCFWQMLKRTSVSAPHINALLLLLLGSFIASIINPRRFSSSSSSSLACFFISSLNQMLKSITASSRVTRDEQSHGRARTLQSAYANQSRCVTRHLIELINYSYASYKSSKSYPHANISAYYISIRSSDYRIKAGDISF